MGFWVVATQIFFLCSPLFGKDDQFEKYVSDGLVQPPTRFGIFAYGWLIFGAREMMGFGFSLGPPGVHWLYIPCIGSGNSYQEMWTATIESLAFVVQQDCCVPVLSLFGGEPGFQTHGMNCTSWWFLLREAMRESATKNSTVMVGAPHILGAMWWTTFSNKTWLVLSSSWTFRDGNPKDMVVILPPGAPLSQPFF